MREYESVELENGMIVAKANYEKTLIKKFDDNPLIQAMPSPFISDKEIIRRISYYPDMEEKAIDDSKELIKYKLDEINFYFQALPIHLDLFKKINRLILNGYSTRNPMLQRNRLNSVLGRTNNSHIYSTLLISGISGAGKTISVERILKSQLPQIIVHNNFRGRDYYQIQITYLILEAPYNSSLKALTLNFFKKVDDLIGTNRFSKYTARKLSVDMMLPLMADLAKQIELGVLVIDELQFMSNNVSKLIDYLTSLINILGIPVIFIGTPQIYNYLTKEMRLARRITSEKQVLFKGISDINEFRLFLNGLFKYQYVEPKIELSENIIEKFYNVTQGIPDFCVKLFIRIQKYMIQDEIDFTLDIVDFIFDEEFKLVKEMIEALKSKNPHRLALYEDLNLFYFEDEVSKNVVNHQRKNSCGKKISEASSFHKKTNSKNHAKHSLENLRESDIRLIKNTKDYNSIYNDLKMKGYIFKLGEVLI